MLVDSWTGQMFCKTQLDDGLLNSSMGIYILPVVGRCVFREPIANDLMVFFSVHVRFGQSCLLIGHTYPFQYLALFGIKVYQRTSGKRSDHTGSRTICGNNFPFLHFGHSCRSLPVTISSTCIGNKRHWAVGGVISEVGTRYGGKRPEIDLITLEWYTKAC